MIQFQLLTLGRPACTQQVEQLISKKLKAIIVPVDFTQTRVIMECRPLFNYDVLRPLWQSAEYDVLPLV